MSADTVTPPPVAPKAVPPTSRRKRWLKRLLPLAMLLALVVWFAPAIVAKTELRNRFARQALADVHGSVEVGGASLGWFSPVELRDVVIKDEAGRPIVNAPKITSQKSLFALARNQGEPGEFTVENPTVTVVCAANATNIEGTFADYLKDDGKPPAPTRTPVSLKVSGGTLILIDADTQKDTRVEGITASANVPAIRAEPVTVALTAATGNLSAELSLSESSSAKLKSTALALDTFAPLLKRFDASTTLTGTVSTDLGVTWGKDAGGRLKLSVAGVASGRQLAVVAPWLNGDRLAFDSVELPLDVELAGRGVTVRKFDLTCDAGTASVRGTFDPEEATENLFTRPGVSVDANVDVAKLAAKLPKLLHVRGGTELREGKLEVKLASKAGATGTVWEGKIDTSALKAVRDGKVIAWEKPLRVDFVGQYAKGQLPTFDKLVCTSDFVGVEAVSTPETIRVAAGVYLDKLGARLADFVDLGGFTLGGTASATLAGRRERDGRFNAEAIVELTNFAFVDRNKSGLKEPALALQINATGTLPDDGPVRLATGKVALAAGGDTLTLTLLEPVADARKLSTGSAEVKVTGELARWKSRVASLVRLPELPLGGTLDARGTAKLTAERVTVDRLTVTIANAKLGRWIALDEPKMDAVGDLAFARASGVATVTKLTINSPTLSVTGGTLSFEPQQNGGVAVSGNGQCTADLNRLGKTVKLYADANGSDALGGTGVGPVRFRTSGNLTTFGGALDVTNFGYGPKAKPVWAEPTLRLETDASYTAATKESPDAVKFASAKVVRPGLTIDAKGTLANVTATPDLNFTGTLRYDWAALTPRVREFVGTNFTATGTGSRGFVLTRQLPPASNAVAVLPPPTPEPKVGGPIVLKAPAPAVPVPKAPAVANGPSIFAALGGEGALGWHSIQAYGFDIGTGELNAKMTRGVATVAPISATVGGGKVTLTPTLELATDPGAVTFAKGRVVDHAKLTPGAVGKGGALRYALPAVADTVQAEGEISATLDDNRISFGDINQTNLKGTLVIHRATVGLSPVAAQVANVLGAKATTMTLVNESSVPVQVLNGRVHHQNFAVRISGTTFHTSGSVGFDDTLDLVVDVPLPKELPLLKNNPLLMNAVAGKVVKVALKGTLTKPELDPKAFENAVIALAREGAKDAGKELLESELRKLFPGMPAPGANPKPSGGLIPFPLPFGKKP